MLSSGACPIPQSLVCNDGQRILPSAFKYGKIGESASYLVKDGYALVGTDPVCQPDSTWSAPPKCLSKLMWTVINKIGVRTTGFAPCIVKYILICKLVTPVVETFLYNT